MMPYLIKRLPVNKYRVMNKHNGSIHLCATSLLNAQRQVRLMSAIDYGCRLKKENVRILQWYNKNDNTRKNI